MAEPRVRLNAVKLDKWDPILLWYARAVAKMRKIVHEFDPALADLKV